MRIFGKELPLVIKDLKTILGADWKTLSEEEFEDRMLKNFRSSGASPTEINEWKEAFKIAFRDAGISIKELLIRNEEGS
jgi:hypothetical protein